MAWDPEQYMQFKRDRMRPAEELINRIPIETPGTIVDLGCGPATSTGLLAKRFPDAQLTGIDNSEQMIEQAREQCSGADYHLADASKWIADQPVDLIFCNAVLHWLPDHPALISRLSNSICKQGVLAIQMPNNMDEPSHRIMVQIAESGEFGPKLKQQLEIRHEIATAHEYYNWLQAEFTHIDIWQTSYSHVMPGAKQIVEWMKGAALTPFLSVLDSNEQELFLRRYLELIEKAYPEQEDSKVLFRFPRMFMVAGR